MINSARDTPAPATLAPARLTPGSQAREGQAHAAAGDDGTDAIVAAGPRGAFLLAGIATAAVVLLWIAFYVLVFLPRAPAA